MGQGAGTRPITDKDFLIERPFGDISRSLFEEWFDAATLFVDAKELYSDQESFVSGVNECFPSLAKHSTKYDDHISGGRPGVYETARVVGSTKGKSRKTRAFLLLE